MLSPKYSKYFLKLLIISSISHELVNAQNNSTTNAQNNTNTQNNNTTNTQNNTTTDLYNEDPVGFLSVVITGHVCIFLSAASILFLLNRIYYRWVNKRKSLSLALRVPFYLGMLACQGVAVSTIAFTHFHRLIAAGISIITYYRICKQKWYDTGKYDWKLFLPSAIGGSLVAAINLANYGSVVYWCAAKPKTLITPISSIVMTIVVFVICLFCYIKTIQEIHAIKKQHLSYIEDRNTSKHPINAVEIKVIIKVMGYILVFMIQWIPVTFYDIYQLLGVAQPWVYCMAIISTNIGSIGNTIFFIINEGFRHKDKGDDSSSISNIKSENLDYCNNSTTYININNRNVSYSNNSSTISTENKSREVVSVHSC
ncbi:17806_t:CDS:2 [Cetraspora pellucida]|uniref:17806_t:CDS:1 n=1 Tax=Cetraspora pellucida TaxID=1433469 RepID=A0A9N9CF93_9GLOM|nr:17806_t:CDS:2 [Cetraspora pellucida]